MCTKLHVLKILPEFFERVLDGSKPFEIRYNDRDYKVGDVLKLEEYKNNKRSVCGRYICIRLI
jgi:hypothetical protein